MDLFRTIVKKRQGLLSAMSTLWSVIKGGNKKNYGFFGKYTPSPAKEH